MLDEIVQTDPHYEPIKIIEQETARCADVVKDLLEFARLKPPQRTRVDILQLLEDSVFLLIPRLKQNKVTIIRAYEKGIPYTEVDPGLIQQVFLNVMINAIQAMPHGGELSLSIRNSTDGKSKTGQQWARITIADMGQGISEKDMGRVFDPFFTTKGSKGTGLGLSVCQRIMDDHFGRIKIESREGGGTSCSLYLPV
jgi:two-component system NtrC family sensor kinase